MGGGIEEGLRRALKNAGRSNPRERALIYQAADRAIRKVALEKGFSDEWTQARRQTLREAVDRIEAEFRDPSTDMAEADEPRDVIAPPGGCVAATADAQAPADEALPPIPGGDEPRGAFLGIMSQGASDPRRAHRTRNYRPDLILFGLGGIAIGALVAILYGFQQGGAPAQGPQEEPITIAQVIDRDVQTASIAENDGWISLLPAERSSTGDTGGPDDGVGTRSGPPDNDGDLAAGLSVPIPAESMARLVGRPLRFELTVGTADGRARRVELTCETARAEFCEPRRVDVTQARQSLAFDGRIGRDAGGDGRIVLKPLATGDGGGLRVYGFRVRPIESAGT